MAVSDRLVDPTKPINSGLHTLLQLTSGLEMANAHASPANRAQAGPLERFTAMVRMAPKTALLGHREAHFGPIAVSATQAG